MSICFFDFLVLNGLSEATALQKYTNRYHFSINISSFQDTNVYETSQDKKYLIDRNDEDIQKFVCS